MMLLLPPRKDGQTVPTARRQIGYRIHRAKQNSTLGPSLCPFVRPSQHGHRH
jgi:hypothetical protein